MSDDDSGPLHLLDSAKGSNVIAKLKNGSTVTGTLRAYDLHLNMYLEEATMRDDGSETQYGTLLVRGDNVIVVSPE